MAVIDYEIRLYALNLRRLMARSGLTLEQVVHTTGVCERTIKVLLRGRSKPHSRTLHRLAAGLGVSPDEFFKAVEEQRADEAIHKRVDELLANGQRELLTGLIELLGRGARAMPSQSSQPHERYRG